MEVRCLIAIAAAALAASACSGGGAARADAGQVDAAADTASPPADAPPPADAAAPDASPPEDAALQQDGWWPAPVHDYYVATTGDDGADGSQAHPWRTIAHADTVVGPGDWVHVLPGTYAAGVVTAAAGSSALRVRYLSEQRFGAQLVATTASSAVPWTITGDWQDVVGFDLSSSASPQHSPAVGLRISASHARAIGNRVHDVSMDPGCNGTSGGGGIVADGYVGGAYAGSDNEILGNFVSNIGNGTSCIGVHGIVCSSLRCVIQNNVVLHASAYGIVLNHAADHAIVANNTVMHAEVRSCLFVGGTGNDYPGGNGYDDSTTVVNNLLAHCGSRTLVNGYGIVDNIVTGPHNFYSSNLIFDTVQGSCQLTNGTCQLTQTADPQLVSDTGTALGDYRLAAASPAVDRGTTGCAATVTGCTPTVDIDCGARPAGAAIDIGAYERDAVGGWPCSQ